ncbi:MAG: hypothetical protein M0R32_03565 [Candidatus Cloacimonetes bacterium]|jgi:hypothetical protein|nr:hypothetical protein [Candidatus Cloacimonadota bacterium]
MSLSISTTSAKLIALLENAMELAVIHQQRTIAADAVRACGIYSENLKTGVAADWFLDLSAAILDKPSVPLSEMFKDVQTEIIKADKGRNQSPV